MRYSQSWLLATAKPGLFNQGCIRWLRFATQQCTLYRSIGAIEEADNFWTLHLIGELQCDEGEPLDFDRVFKYMHGLRSLSSPAASRAPGRDKNFAAVLRHARSAQNAVTKP